jgi:hypothetical protein
VPYRTTAQEVSELLGEDVATVQDVFLLSANEMVTELCVPMGYTDVRLELIERYLAAHFYTVENTRADMEGIAGGPSEHLQGKTEEGLRSSLYGQAAMRLDTKGALAVMDNGQLKYAKPPAAVAGKGVGILYVGQPNPNQDSLLGWSS